MAPEEGVFSPRLVSLIDDVLQGRAPNAGRFCGYCYSPVPTGRQALAPERDLCPRCGRSTEHWPVCTRLPLEVIDMYRAQRSREGLVVRGLAWGGLTVGVVVALLPLVLAGATWWAILSLFAILGLFYLLSANLANSLGDALGYRWGQALVRRRWAAFVAERDARPSQSP